MKTIGLIGGMSAESTVSYYKIINQAVNQRLGGLHSAKIILYSVDFAEIQAMQKAGNWSGAGELLLKAALSLQAAGADCVVLCTNTMHKVAPAIEAGINIPFLHIADATAKAIKRDGFKKTGLLGTQFTMEQNFYKNRLIDTHGLNVVVPNETDRKVVHAIIYDELCKGIINVSSKLAYQRIMANLVAQGAQAIILGCTEIGLLIQPEDSPVPVFDTTLLHATAAVEFALA